VEKIKFPTKYGVRYWSSKLHLYFYNLTMQIVWYYFDDIMCTYAFVSSGIQESRSTFYPKLRSLQASLF
jgi:hypothetical protein